MSRQKKKSSKRAYILRMIRVRSHRYGTLSLRGLAVGDEIELKQLLELDLDPREFTVRIIANQIENPALSIEEVRTWSDRLLERVVKTWASSEQAFNTKIPNDVPIFQTFYSIAKEYTEQQSVRLAQLVNSALGQTAAQVLTETLEATQARIGASISELYSDSLDHLARGLGDYATTAMQSYFDSVSFSLSQTAAIIAPEVTQAILDRSVLLANELVNFSLEPVISRVQEIAADYTNASKVLQDSLQHIELNFHPYTNADYLFDNFPDLSELVQWSEKLRTAQQILKQHGYDFTLELWDLTFVQSFAVTRSKSTGASVTRKMLSMTRRVTFGVQFQQLMESSKWLQRRSKILRRALEAHKHRDYLVSIPLLLTQLEGIIADLLLLKGFAKSKNGKLYVKGADGKLKLDKKNNPIELKGLSSLIQHSDFRQHDVLKLTVDLLMYDLAPERNVILHGRRTSYATAKRSTQLVLLVYVLSDILAIYESGAVP